MGAGPAVGSSKISWIAAVIALAGLTDATYLVIHHYTATPVPCGAGFDCEMVLSSPYSDIAGIPLAAFGALAYFVAFSLALLTAYGDGRMWKLFGAIAMLMACFSLWLIYVQAEYIHAFCQYCLVSAGTSILLFIIFVISIFVGRRATA